MPGPNTAPRLRPLQLLLPDCVRFNSCSPDCVRFDCCSPIAYWIPSSPSLVPRPRGRPGNEANPAHARAQYCSPIASASTAARPMCVRFNCCSPIAYWIPAHARAQCCSPIAFASTATPRLRPLQQLLARLRPLRLLLPDCILDSSSCPGPMFSKILRGVRGSVNKLKYEGCASL